MRVWVIIGILFLMACSETPTAQVIQENVDDKMAVLEEQLENTKAALGSQTQLVSDAKVLVADLEQQIAEKQKFIDQQKQVLRELDDERVEATKKADGCDERIEELEKKNDGLQKLVNVCTQELD